MHYHFSINISQFGILLSNITNLLYIYQFFLKQFQYIYIYIIIFIDISLYIYKLQLMIYQ